MGSTMLADYSFLHSLNELQFVGGLFTDGGQVSTYGRSAIHNIEYDKRS
jgi:hypothetical protein